MPPLTLPVPSITVTSSPGFQSLYFEAYAETCEQDIVPARRSRNCVKMLETSAQSN